MVKVYVNGVEVEVPPGVPIIEAVEKAGYRVPVLCYLNDFFSEATCRLCVVLVNGRVVPACKFPVSDGAKIVTESRELDTYRRMNFQLLLSTHRIKCWSCLRKTSCSLLDLSKQLNLGEFPVCSECPLTGDDCLVAKGEPCLGPLTAAGCSAECTRNGVPCLGCRGYIEDPELWRDSMRDLYEKHGVDGEKLEAAAKFFWSFLPGELKKIISEVSRDK
ncbi:MAG: 2Fe-2S iron-sulfur cluster-binding protein [Sulfolobales archaeon]|nr:2Fe-2S iron-sulfur cluster-binding protein [Sulfolobales archaeon]MDW8082333.1 2Fe-2S iron-sulfur cluster-binding protein [Sulfolobales archaeon]